MSYPPRASISSVSSASGIMHHQVKLDVFIIKGYKLLTQDSLINGNDVSIVNTAANSPTVSGTMNSKDLTDFHKLSQLYNATISTASLDDSSTSPKSAIELYQRFQQILKELELSYEGCPYGKYFHRLDNCMWQIKDDSELINDQLWQLVTVSISNVYDPKTKTFLNNGKKRINSATTSAKHSPVATNSTTMSSTGPATSDNDTSLPQQLQKKLQKLQENMTNGYYTTPTSPVATTSNCSTNSIVNSWRKRKFKELDTFDEEAVEELLQLAKKKRQEACAGADLPPIDETSTSKLPRNEQMTIGEHNLYDRLLKEKDGRIQQLEKDLALQRQETQWLRKMLVEDMGCVRSMLQKLNQPGRPIG